MLVFGVAAAGVRREWQRPRAAVGWAASTRQRSVPAPASWYEAASDERVASRTVLCDERWQREEAGAREEMIEASTWLVP